MDKSVGKWTVAETACAESASKWHRHKKNILFFMYLRRSSAVQQSIVAASAGLVVLCISFGDLAELSAPDSRHRFVMPRCDTVSRADMTPLHDAVPGDAALSLLPQSAHGVARSTPFFFWAQSRPRDAIETGSPEPITR